MVWLNVKSTEVKYRYFNILLMYSYKILEMYVQPPEAVVQQKYDIKQEEEEEVMQTFPCPGVLEMKLCIVPASLEMTDFADCNKLKV